MFGLKGIHHLAMATRDIETTIRFWRDLLGMRLVGGLGKKGYKLYFFEISHQNYIVFFEWPEVEPVAEKDHGMPASGPMVFDHVSFAVENAQSLCALREALDAAGFWVSDVIDHGIIHSIYSFDPNGIPIEFSASVPGVDLGAFPALVDTSPGPAALEGPEPVAGIWPKARSPVECSVFPGEGREMVDGSKKNWFK
ncbi:MAG: VOC family protein [Syntrophobacteraceae bacterium]|nr:VOC family protein [Syntrophobacteraceae bacterium]